MHLVLSGVTLLAYAVIGLIFARFWSRSGERLFLFFCIAFALLAVERVMLIAVALNQDDSPGVYVTRLLAFILIVAGIVDRNRRAEREP